MKGESILLRNTETGLFFAGYCVRERDYVRKRVPVWTFDPAQAHAVKRLADLPRFVARLGRVEVVRHAV